MALEKLSLVHSQENVRFKPERRLDLGNACPGYRLTALVVMRPSFNFVFVQNRLEGAILKSGVTLEVRSLDPDRVTRFQSFQYNDQDTTITLRYSSATEDRFVLLEYGDFIEDKFIPFPAANSVDHTPA